MNPIVLFLVLMSKVKVTVIPKLKKSPPYLITTYKQMKPIDVGGPMLKVNATVTHKIKKVVTPCSHYDNET